MTPDFQYYVFLSHSSQNKPVVRTVADRLRKNGLRVCFDKWEIKPGNKFLARTGDGLAHSRMPVLCMSTNAFASEWAQLDVGTFRFRDPLKKDRRFIPLRLDDATSGLLVPFLHINYLPPGRERIWTILTARSGSSDNRGKLLERMVQR